jgi:hypothetical protein
MTACKIRLSNPKEEVALAPVEQIKVFERDISTFALRCKKKQAEKERVYRKVKIVKGHLDTSGEWLSSCGKK